MQDNLKPLLLIVLDGWGHGTGQSNDAISSAKKPTWDRLWREYPHTLVSGSGLDVGLPAGQMGNSEVGHMTIGSGRVIFQDLTRINQAITDGSFAANPAIKRALQIVAEKQSALHILGLLSPGGIHSHEKQIFALIKIAAQQNISNIYVHAFLDGRDTPPQSAAASLQQLQALCEQFPNVHIASIMGRFFAMDRDKRTERTAAAMDLLVNGLAPFHAPNAALALQMAYARGETDEFVQPTIITDCKISDDDVVIFMNFRADRARQISTALTTNAKLHLADFVTLTDYDPQISAHVAFPKDNVRNTLGEVLQQHHLKQLRIAETEKYAHVTFFFNAGKEEKCVSEDRILIPSPKVTTYDLAPAMAAVEITDKLIQFIEDKSYDVIICNYANADMVGHTGNYQAAIQAIEVLDNCLGRICAALEKFGGQALITADHGNAEVMWDDVHNQPHTAHTTNLVPVLYVGKGSLQFKQGSEIAGLQSIAPTILELLNIPKPAEMSGESLF